MSIIRWTYTVSVFVLGVFIVAFCLVHTDEALAVARVLTVAVFALALGYLVVNEYRLPIWDAQPRRDGKYLQSLATGEFRPPLKGEWYLSGAKPTAYRASNDFNASYYIMRLVVVEQSTYVVKRIMTHKQATE